MGPPELLLSWPPGTSIVFDMSLTYILVALAAVLLNNVLVERLNLHTRITTGAPRGSSLLACPALPTWPPSASRCLSVKWAYFLRMPWASVGENPGGSSGSPGDGPHPQRLLWPPHCVPGPGTSSSPDPPCSSFPFHGHVQLQGSAQMVPPPGSAPGCPPSPLTLTKY